MSLTRPRKPGTAERGRIGNQGRYVRECECLCVGVCVSESANACQYLAYMRVNKNRDDQVKREQPQAVGGMKKGRGRAHNKMQDKGEGELYLPKSPNIACYPAWNPPICPDLRVSSRVPEVREGRACSTGCWRAQHQTRRGRRRDEAGTRVSRYHNEEAVSRSGSCRAVLARVRTEYDGVATSTWKGGFRE